MTTLRIERALISVSDKTGISEFARGLTSLGVTIYASGGTRRHLESAGIPVQEVSGYTGFPEIMDGRIKTLHPKIHAGILCRRDHPPDMASLAEHGIVPLELVVVNLYPFEQTVAQDDVSIDEAVQQIDIGGPTLVRGAAKNHAFVTIASQPAQYRRILEQIQAQGATAPELRRELAAAAFAHTAQYDAAIARYFGGLAGPCQSLTNDRVSPSISPAEATAEDSEADHSDQQLPAELTISLRRQTTLRYGENPHQVAALYSLPSARPHSLVGGQQLHGKELSYNNLLDLDSALAVVRSLPVPGVVVLKHNNPCGAATAPSLVDAMRKAWEGDPQSAFGSVLGFNVPVDGPTAEYLAEPGRFVEAIVAPDFAPDAVEILTTKPKWKANVRLLKVGPIEPGTGDLVLRQIDVGMLCQTADDLPDEPDQWSVATTARPTDQQFADLRFAWAACRHVRSNAIVLARDGALVGVGAGQMSRVDAVEIAIRKAGDRARGAVLASDAFFPFADSIHRAAEAGVVAVVQPGGSRRDAEVIQACNERQLPMLFTGCRHFRH